MRYHCEARLSAKRGWLWVHRCPVHLEVTAAPLSLLRTVSTIPEPVAELEEKDEEEEEAARPPAAVSTGWRRASVVARGEWRVAAGSPIVVLLTARVRARLSRFAYHLRNRE